MMRLAPLNLALAATFLLSSPAIAQDIPLPGGDDGDGVQTIATQPGDLLDEDTNPEEIAVPDIEYEQETLDNGLRVIYAPMSNAPVVHVRVFYHVGSKDEKPDRQGFAHMFEHMMFRGSEHVPSEEHMRLINSVGGNSNAYTSFDETVYINTVPSNALEMALWLEADRMSSFKVDEEKFNTERNVVNEEYLQRVVNPPYGRLFLDFFQLAFDEAHYRWTPIGDMEQLRESTVAELQDFYDTYYAPNNAVLVIAGQFDMEQAKQWVREYFGWIESGETVSRLSPEEPDQQQPRRKVVYAPNAPLPRITMGFKTPGWGHEDEEALAVLGNILGQGRSSRLYQALVAGSPDNPPVANFAGSGSQRLEDAGVFFVSIGVLPGQDPDEVEQKAMEVLERVAEEGVTEAELSKAKMQLKLSLLNSRQTADNIAGDLASAAAYNDDPEYVNTAAERIDAVTAEDVKRVAEEYLTEDRLSVLQYRPGEAPAEPAAPAEGVPEQRTVPQEQADDLPEAPAEDEAPPAESAALDSKVYYISMQDERRFPSDYPTTAPVPTDVIEATFDMGESFEVGPMTVVVIEDDRLPLVGMTLLMPGGGDALPPEKAGLESLTAELLSRGAGGLSGTEFSEALESRGISLSAGDGGDHTRLSASFPKQAAEDAARFAREMLVNPTLDPDEFRNLKFRTLASLQQSLSDPSSVAGRDLRSALFGDAPAGRSADLQTVSDVTLEGIKEWHEQAYRPQGATLILAGDVTRDDAEQFATQLLEDWDASGAPDTADYTLEPYERQIIVIDNSGGGQSAVRLGTRAFTTASEEKFPAGVATQILSGGIESRLMRAMRAERGLTYGAYGRFGIGRNAGDFTVNFNTRPETTGEAIQTAFEVLREMGSERVSDEELAEAKRRVTGSLVMSTQTVGQQASLRGTITLNGYPLDYYSTYADKIAAVTAEDVRQVIAEYGDPEKLTIVVVGPAEQVVPQLEPFGEVTVLPMPLNRE